MFRFAVTGGIATVTHVVVFVALVEMLRIAPVVASIPAFLTALGVSYIGHRSWTFRSTGSHLVELPKFALVAVIGLAGNAGITYAVVDLAGLYYVVALAVAVTVVPAATFFASNRWVFSRESGGAR